MQSKVPSEGVEPLKVASSEGARSYDLAEVPVNASGHAQELGRNFGFLSIASMAITSGNTWITFGGSIVSTFEYTWCA